MTIVPSFTPDASLDILLWMCNQNNLPKGNEKYRKGFSIFYIDTQVGTSMVNSDESLSVFLQKNSDEGYKSIYFKRKKKKNLFP